MSSPSMVWGASAGEHARCVARIARCERIVKIAAERLAKEEAAGSATRRLIVLENDLATCEQQLRRAKLAYEANLVLWGSK
jgi:hypothetical protein